MDEGNRARARMLKWITANLAFQRNAKVTFKWPNFHLFQFFDCHPGFYLWAIILSVHLKTKTWPQEDCYWESAFANSRRSHVCSEEPEVRILLSRERTLGHEQLWKHGLRGCSEPGSEPHGRLLTKCHSHIPRKTNMNGIKTPREGGFE